MKVVIYVRISKRKDQTTENQELILVEYAKRMNYEYEIFREEESTRKTRPIKQKVLNMLRHKEYDGLLILKLDRWGRSLQELVMDMNELREKGVALISVRDNIDLTTSSGRMMFGMIAVIAEYERDIIHDRTMDGLERAKSQGKKLGRPFGSKKHKNNPPLKTTNCT